MQAVILAAGMGRRLGEYTENNTKCMVRVNGETLISRMLHQLEALGSIDRVIIVIGYKGELLVEYIKSLSLAIDVEFVCNPDYEKTNNIYSLYLARNYLCEEDTILLESDLIFEDSVLKILIEDKRDTLALVDKFQSWMDGTCVMLSEDYRIKRFVPRNKFEFGQIDRYYKTVNIYKFSKEFSSEFYVPFLEAYCHALGNNEYYEQVLRVIAVLDNPPIRALPLSGQHWYEIDDANDLNISSTIFADPETKLKRMEKSYGGFWRYTDILDFCYLVNPYYPPQEMLEEIKNSMEVLIRSYPSGQYQNDLLAARNFDIHIDNIAVGNGAAELIKAIADLSTGKFGIIRPTFEEYPNRINRSREITYYPTNFDYSVTDIINFYDDKDINNLIIINPDNPSGNFISKNEMLRLCEWTSNKAVRLIIDESFIDFAEGTIESNSILSQELINRFPNIIIVKSISKSYGIPGLRIGILASGDLDLISKIKKTVSIWNINSLAEFYMQIYLKYKKAYIESLELIKIERKYLRDRLSTIDGLYVYPSEANYLMVKLPGGINAHDLSVRLLSEHSILVKDLSSKIKDSKGAQYIRVAVKTRAEDDHLINAFHSILARESKI